MKNCKRITVLLLALVACLLCTSVNVFAATLEELYVVNATVTLDGTNAETATVAISTPGDFGLYAVVGNWSITEDGSNYLTLTSIGSDAMVFEGDNSATVEDGEVYYVDDNFETYFVEGQRILYATYTVAANTPAGEYTVSFEPYDGMFDTDVGEYYDAFTFTITVTKAASEPSCNHPNTKLVSNGDGTHNVVCGNSDCNEIVEGNVDCTEDPSKTAYSVGSNPQCCVPGNQWKDTYCACGYTFDAEWLEGTIPATGEHTLSKIDQVDPTCRLAGHKEYWKCDKMGFCYEDAKGTIKIDDIVEWTIEGEGFIAKDPNAHGNFTYDRYGDDTHKEVCGYCYETVRENVPCSGGTATCYDRAFCDYCDYHYGDYNHAGEQEFEYFDGLNHEIRCSKCGDLWFWDADKCYAPHEADDGKCVCGAFGLVTDFNGGKLNTTAPDFSGMTDEEWQEMLIGIFGSLDIERMAIWDINSLSLDVSFENIVMMNHQFVKNGYKIVGVAYDKEGKNLVKEDDVFSGPATLYYVWEEHDVCTPDHYEYAYSGHDIYCFCGEQIGEEVPHKAEDNGYCVCGAYALVIDFNGGELNTTAPDGFEENDADWQEWLIELFGSLDAKSLTEFIPDGVETPISSSGLELMIIKNGYKLVGLAYDEDGKNLVKDDDKFSGPTTLYFVWECQHEKTEFVDNGNGTHTEKCECGKTFGEPVAHSYDAQTHKCVCGKVETFTVTYHSNGGDMFVNGVPFSSFPLTYFCTEVVYARADQINNLEFWVVKQDKCFAGWNTKADGSGTAYAIGAPITEKKDITLYAQYKDIAVDGVAMNSGEYLDCFGNVTTTKPEGGYAYYKDGILTLHNFVGTDGRYATSVYTEIYCAFFMGSDVTVVLEGDNTLSNYRNGIFCDNLTIRGDGILTIVSGSYAINSYETITIESGNIYLNGRTTAMQAEYDIIINGGTVTGTGELLSKGKLNLHGVIVISPAGTTFGSYGGFNKLLGSDGEPVTSFVIGKCGHTEKSYTDLGDDFHKVTCATCGETINEAVAHSYDAQTHKCVCGDVEKFQLTVQTVDTNYSSQATLTSIDFYVPYGANIWEFIQEKIKAGEITGVGTKYMIDQREYDIPVRFYGYNITGDYCVDNSKLNDSYTMPAESLTLIQEVDIYTGWYYEYEDAQYILKGEWLSGWCYIEEDFDDVEGGAWYYFDTKTDYRAEGLTRVPYNEELGHGALAEDLAYNPNFIDAESAWYYFDENGKYESNKNGIIDGKYVVNGMIPWHPGFVTVDGELYYFVGDAEKGGNKAAEGDIYVTRLNDITGFTKGDVYNFANGKLSGLNGIADGKYYENSKLMMGKGLVKTDKGYIYVRSNGYVAVGQYWVTKTNDMVNAGMYNFGTDGILVSTVDPSVNGLVDGVYYKNGMPYYAGLIEIDGAIYYVRSNGQVATGKYYVTKVDNYNGDLDIKSGDKLVFGEDGKMEPIKNGIVEENGALYYYEKNHLMCGAGLIELEGDIYYVRSSGEVQTGYFYISKTNKIEGFKTGDKCKFDEDGKLLFVVQAD